MAANSARLDYYTPFLKARVLESMPTRKDCMFFTIFQTLGAECTFLGLGLSIFLWKIWNDGQFRRTSVHRLTESLYLDRGSLDW